jgi:hypothetical protein
MVHRWKATGIVRPEPAYPRHEFTFKRRLERIRPDREKLWPSTGIHEVGVAVSCLPTGTIGQYIGIDAGTDLWKKSQPDHFITGSIDYVGTWWDGSPWVDDLKTGKNPPSPRSVQWWLYALAVHRLHLGNPDHVTVTCTHWPRYPATGAPQRPPELLATITRTELMKFERHIRLKYEQWEEIRYQATLNPDILNPGEKQCLYCPALDCPSRWSEE